MPNIKSAKKRVLVNQKKNQMNRSIISEVKTAIKKYNAAINSNNLEEAERLLPLAVSKIDSATSKGVFHKNYANNHKSKLSRKLSDIKSGKTVITIVKDNKTLAAEKAMAAKEAREAIRAENARKASEKAALKAATEEKTKKKSTKKVEEKTAEKTTEKTAEKKVRKTKKETVSE